MIVGSSSQVFQQISGCNAVIYYLPVLLEDSIGQSHDFALLIGGVNMICYAIFATFSWFFIEKIGRRKLFIGGSFGQCVAMIIVFACLIPGDAQTAKGAVFGLFLFFAAWNAFFIPVIWFFYPETSGRSLEEIDLIFAKGYVEKINYVRAAKELPRLTDEEIEAKAAEYGILDDNEKTEERVMEGDPAATAEFSSFQPTQL